MQEGIGLPLWYYPFTGENGELVIDRAFGDIRPFHEVVESATGARENFSTEAEEKGDDTGAVCFLSLTFSLAVLAIFAAAIPPALGWSMSTKLFPLVTASVAPMVVAIAVMRDAKALRDYVAGDDDSFRKIFKGFATPDFSRAAAFFAWCAGVIALSPLVGQQVALISSSSCTFWYGSVPVVLGGTVRGHLLDVHVRAL